MIDWSIISICCGYCEKRFNVEPTTDLTAEIICPECENVTTLTPRYRRRIFRSYLLYGTITLLISSAVSVSLLLLILAAYSRKLK